MSVNESKIPTPHINAGKDDFAETVLMPGDPLRAKYIAENFLTDAKLVNNVRGVQGYTGYYEGKRVSVMASGMGMPSIGIYSYELFNYYDVKNIIRIGSAGSVNEKLKVRDIVVAMSAFTDSNIGAQYGINAHLAPTASYELLEKAMNKGRELGYKMMAGPIYSSDVFYDELGRGMQLAKLGVLAIEMESAALYLNAAKAGKNALCICTISDSLVTGEELNAEERQNSFREMMKLALEIA